MELSTIIPHIEALIFASDKPLTSLDIVELINTAFGFMEERISLDQVEAAVEGIREKYNAEFYPFEVRESGGGWQFLTKKEFHQTVGQLNGDKFLKRLSNAALETLAIVAYKQPITKGEVEAIRGVNSDYSIQKLLEKELIVISGRNENLPGKPLVYATSKAFMDYFGINDTNDLPKIKEVLAEQLIEATVVNSALNAQENDAYRAGMVDESPKQQIELFGENKKEETASNESDKIAENASEETVNALEETFDLKNEATAENLDEENVDILDEIENENVALENLDDEGETYIDEDENISESSHDEVSDTLREKEDN
jgi:segregation and condensation protein B